MNENLPTSNNNPGDLRDAGQVGATQGSGGFAAFASPEAGFGALENQITTDINRSPNETLEEFVGGINGQGGYAPASDGNNVGEYTAKLATDLGASPIAPLGSLSSKVGQFTAAVANIEGYNMNEGASSQSSSLSASDIASGAAGVGLGAAGAGIGALASSNILPEAGGIVGAAVGTPFDLVSGPAGTAVGAIGGTAIGEGAKGLLGLFTGGGQSQTLASQGQTDTSQTPSTPTPPEVFPGESQTELSPVAAAVNNALTTTVGGNEVLNEAKNRGVDNLGMEMAQMGLVPQTDANGNYDKISPTLIANSGNASDATFLNEAAGGMSAQTSLADARDAAITEAKSKMQNSPDLDATLDKINKTFEGHGRQHANQVDKNGRSLSLSQQFVSPLALRQMEVRASEGENWATAPHERSASQHIKTALSKRLSAVAKNEKVKGWDETKRRMEIRFLIKKAIKKLPKKAQRDFKKELLKEVAGIAAGGLIGKLLGQNTVASALVGGLVQHQLHSKNYKNLASKKERALMNRRANARIKRLVQRQAK